MSTFLNKRLFGAYYSLGIHQIIYSSLSYNSYFHFMDWKNNLSEDKV